MRFKRTALTAILVPGLALSVASLLGADEPDGMGAGQGRVSAGRPAMSRDISAAVRRDLGVSTEQLREQGALQEKAIRLDEALQTALGQAYAGSSYDARTGKLVVMVSDAKALDKAKAAGAEARLVKHSKAELDAIKDELDVAAGKTKGSGTGHRQPNGTRQASVAGMTSWYVDTATNTVRVTVEEGQAKAVENALAKYGDAVTLEKSDLAPTTTTIMDGSAR